jgi:GT2 family glycosyltransferase
MRFKQRQHYSRVLSAALSFGRGEKIFFLSNDMVFTPDFFRTLLEVSNLDPTIGIVRGTSNYTDSHPEHTVNPPFPIRSFNDVLNFSQYASVYWGQHFVEDHILSGDAVLINRALIDKIGVVDTQYYGYFGDVDYGLRAMRAGFKLVCAKGAWLLHQGGGYVKDEAASTKTELEPHYAVRMKTVQNAYAQYRKKWDLSLPELADNAPIASEHLKKIEPLNLHEYFPPVVLTPELAEIM